MANRIQKLLEGANILGDSQGHVKLASVVSNVLGVSGRSMLDALAQGGDDPEALASLARGQLKAKRAELERALLGLMGDHQRFLLQSTLRQLDFLEQETTLLDEEVGRRLAPFAEALERLDAIPGVGRRTAEEVVAEIGLDMSYFPSAQHLASWARLCPGNNQSGP